MKPDQSERLRQNEGKVVKITCSDGELLEAKIVHVDDEHRDAVYDLVLNNAREIQTRHYCLICYSLG